MDCVFDGAIEFLAAEGMLGHIMQPNPYTCSTLATPAGASSMTTESPLSRLQNSASLVTDDTTRRSSFSNALQWFVKPMNSKGSSFTTRDLNVISPQST